MEYYYDIRFFLKLRKINLGRNKNIKSTSGH